MTTTSTSTNSESLLITFLSPTPFYSNPVRSFLHYLQKKTSSSLQFINFPKNLYTASEILVKDYQPLTASLQLPQGIQHPAVIAITPTQNDSFMLTLDLGSDGITSQLVGEEADNASMTWLIDILSTGGRMTRADCAFVSLDTQANQTTKIRADYGRLYLDEMPLMLWTTVPVFEDISNHFAEAWITEQQSDGAFLIRPQQPLENRTTQTQYSLWIDVTQTRYFLIPHTQKIPDGNFPIYNLDGEQKDVAIAAIASFEITQKQAKAHLETEINQAIEQAKNTLFHTITLSIGKSPETVRPTTTLSELIAVLLGVSIDELADKPELAKVGLENIITAFKNVIKASLSQDQNQLDLVRQQMRSWQTILENHGIDLGQLLEQFPDQLNDLHLSTESAASIHQMTSKLRKLADQIDQPSDNKERNFTDAITNFVKNYREIFGQENEAQKQERLQQEYRKMADKAIVESLSQYPMPSLKFEDLLPKPSHQQDD
ncbi:MAG TPA: hypothetical protein DCL61_18480 [Cyanobacteria bacterium UBA12227]|nr:hypothetical protein [Cyanobacteria bacterium UBA12227]HAX85361.1 hypothetical protein [Cyanobacteria bacterium UBA11370]HBY77800.1 hypothetical protein [Cyanobacteria bacterium UBA11148]